MKEDSLLTWDGYYNRYIFYLKKGYTGFAAYTKVKMDYENETGVEKAEVSNYGTYSSFKNTMYKKLKK